MAINPFFEDAESSSFDSGGLPTQAGIYEFRRADGKRILYTLAWSEPEDGGAPRLRVIRASSMGDYPYPAHALDALDGAWIRYLGLPAGEGDGTDPQRQA